MDDATPATRIFLLRHGQTDWNIERRLQGQTDIGLNDHGREQARRLGAALAGEPLDAIYSSDLLRALDTARAVAEVHALQVQPDVSLRERHFGVFEGLTYPEVASRYPQAHQRWRDRDPDFGPDGGEVLAYFSDRSVAAAVHLAGRHAGGNVVLVSHGGVLDCLYRAAAGVALNTPRTWELGNAAINRLLLSDGRLVLVGWNDDSHLRDEAPLG